MATGYNFPDALAASALAAHTNSPIVLVGNSVSPQALDFIRQNSGQIKSVFAMGGSPVVSDDILYSIYDTIDAVKKSIT